MLGGECSACCDGWYCCEDTISQCSSLGDVLRVTANITASNYTHYSYKDNIDFSSTTCGGPGKVWDEQTVITELGLFSGTHVLDHIAGSDRFEKNFFSPATGCFAAMQVFLSVQTTPYTPASTFLVPVDVTLTYQVRLIYFRYRHVTSRLYSWGPSASPSPPLHPVSPTSAKTISDMSCVFQGSGSLCQQGQTQSRFAEGTGMSNVPATRRVLCGQNVPFSFSGTISLQDSLGAAVSESGSRDVTYNISIERK